MMPSIEMAVTDMVDELFDKADALTSDPYIRDAVARIVIRQAVHRSVEVMGIGVYELAEHLDTMADVIKDKKYRPL